MGNRQHEFCIDIWFLIITSKMHSVLISTATRAVLGGGCVLPESPARSGEELVVRHTLTSL